MWDSTRQLKEGKPKLPLLVFPSLASLRSGFSLSKEYFFGRINRSKKYSHNKWQNGFTLPELVVSISILGILTVSVLVVFANFFTTITRTNELISMTDGSQNLLRIISEEIRYGAGIRVNNSISDPNAPTGGWNTSNTAFVIITAVPAVDSDDEYIIDPSTGDPYLNEFVYYKSGTTMYKRTLAHPDATGNTLKTSCPASAATASCPADKKLIENAKTMSFILYDQDDLATTDPLLARSIVIDLLLEKETFGQALQFSNTIRMTLRNDF